MRPSWLNKRFLNVSECSLLYLLNNLLIYSCFFNIQYQSFSSFSTDSQINILGIEEGICSCPTLRIHDFQWKRSLSYSWSKWTVINRLTQITTCSSCFPFISRFTGLGSPWTLLSNSDYGNMASTLQMSRDSGNNTLSTFTLTVKHLSFLERWLRELGTFARLLTPQTVPGSGAAGGSSIVSGNVFGNYFPPETIPLLSEIRD